MYRRSFLSSAAMAGAYAMTTGFNSSAQQPSSSLQRSIRIHTGSEQSKFPHIWEECVGSDRAAVGMREQWLQDLELVAKTTGIKSVRFHGLFNDEMAVWASGRQPNFLYIDTVFDAMLGRGVKTFVELSFNARRAGQRQQDVPSSRC